MQKLVNPDRVAVAGIKTQSHYAGHTGEHPENTVDGITDKELVRRAQDESFQIDKLSQTYGKVRKEPRQRAGWSDWWLRFLLCWSCFCPLDIAMRPLHLIVIPAVMKVAVMKVMPQPLAGTSC